LTIAHALRAARHMFPVSCLRSGKSPQRPRFYRGLDQLLGLAGAKAPDRVLVWSSQLAERLGRFASDRGTGRDVRKFRFQTAPGWAYALLLLLCTGVGLLIVFIAMYLVRGGPAAPAAHPHEHARSSRHWIPSACSS